METRIGIGWRFRAMIFVLVAIMMTSCSKDEEFEGPVPTNPEEGEEEVIFLPVVIHVVNAGEEIGEGPNLSEERIKRQIEILNEDFRRKEGTRGFNDHPAGGDAKIEFVLAKQDPNGAPINGINRIDTTQVQVPVLGYSQNHFAQYAYWDPSQYINIWTTPLPQSTECLALGVATLPKTDLPGIRPLSWPGPNDAEGILINWIHFGESNIDCHARYGRTLTHEIGHYLGLLHPWGRKDCLLNDYCEDTPAVDREVFGNKPFIGCAGDTVMIGNFMNWSHDEVMNIFTKDQIARMHYVLENSEGRKSLTSSPALDLQ